MSKIDKFLAKEQEVTIAGEKYMLKPFTVNDLPLLTRMGSKDTSISTKASQELVRKVLKQIDSEATEEQLDNVSIEFLEDIMSAISKLNGIDVDDAKAKLIEKSNAE